MSVVYNLVLVLHFVGMAMLVGGFLAQLSSSPRVVSRTMRDGVLLQLVTGIALAGLSGSEIGTDEKFEPAAVGVKLLVAAVILVIALLGMRRDPEEQQPYWLAAGVLAVVNVLVAVFWVAATAS